MDRSTHPIFKCRGVEPAISTLRFGQFSEVRAACERAHPSTFEAPSSKVAPRYTAMRTQQLLAQSAQRPDSLTPTSEVPVDVEVESTLRLEPMPPLTAA